MGLVRFIGLNLKTRRYLRVKQVDAVLIGDMHLVLKEPLPKDEKGGDEILVRVRFSSSYKPELQQTETVLEG